MDEFQSRSTFANRTLAKRISLAAILCCVGGGVAVGDQCAEAPSASTHTLRSLLSLGPGAKALPVPVATPASETTERIINESLKPKDDAAKLRVREAPSFAVLGEPKSATSIATPPPVAKEKTANKIPELVPYAKWKAPQRQEATDVSSIAELIKRKAVPHIVRDNGDARSDSTRPMVARREVSSSRLAPLPTIEESAVVDSTPAKNSLLEQPAVAKNDSTPIAESDVPALPASVVREQTLETTQAPIIVSSDPPSNSTIENRDESESSIVQVSPPLRELSDDPLDVVAPTERTRRVANDAGFNLYSLDSLTPPKATRLPESSLDSTIHADRYRELARQAQRNSQQRLARHATHSALKFAQESLRLTIDMNDAQSGGNQHARKLDAAMNAFRESKDFGGRFGKVDSRALQRMVAVHETEALKHEDLRNVSLIEASETYLTTARQDLVAAAAGAPEAAEALVLIGLVEKEMASSTDTHAGAVALTLHRAAAEINPNSARAHLELGITLLNQSLVEQATQSLGRSLKLRRSRIAYKKLLEASRRLGDLDTAQFCLRSLRDPNLPSDIPVQTLAPQAFAASYRPNATTFKRASAPANQAQTTQTQSKPAKSKSTSQATEEEPIRFSFRSLFTRR